MPLQRDFMMRMLQKLADAFFRIVAGKRTEDAQQTLHEIEDLLGEALSTPAHFALGQGPAAMDTIEPALAAQLARLLLLHADVADTAGEPGRGRQARRMAFRGLERALERPGTAFARLAAEQLREHYGKLDALTPAAQLAAASMAASRVAAEDRDWAGAEDWLFFALEAAPAPALLDEARAFFAKLEALPADDLRAGGLSRDEVLESARTLDDYVR